LAKFTLGGILLARLRLAGTALCGSTRILEARGIDNLQEVITGRVDPAGAVIPGSESVYRSDGLAVGFGFTANIELAQLAGCDMAFNTGLGGWVVKVNEDLATTVDGIFAAGEITGIGGAAKSLIEGRLAGLTILRQMGRLRSDKRIKEISALKQARRRQIAFARHFNAQHWFAPPYMTNWISRLPDDLLVCRCEEVSLGDLRRAIAEGFGTPAGIKKATRCGMGICQGSTCKTILLEMLSVLTGQPLAHLPLPSVRVPVKPVYLGTLAGGGL
jgi:NAD(P)H-nitrite reductase large subunit